LAVVKILMVVALTMARNGASEYVFHYGDRLAIAAKVAGQHIKAAHIVIGSGEAIIPDQDRLDIDGKLEKLDSAEWQSLMGGNSNHHFTLPPMGKLAFTIGQFNLLGREFTNVKLSSELQPDNAVISIRSRQLNGEITVPNDYPNQAIQATFDRLKIDFQSGDHHYDIDPSDLPPLNVTINDFSLGSMRLGRFDISITPEQNALKINHLACESKLMSFSASGQWQQRNNKDRTELMGSLYTHNLGGLLDSFAITDVVREGDGRAIFQLSWNDTLLNYNLNKLTGKVDAEFKKGRIMKLSKQAAAQIGIGRVLNLFSLQSLPRRLAFDFRDLTEQGFYFDELSGIFTLRNGNLFSQDAKVLGKVAQVFVRGRLGLEDHDYHVDLAITPNVTSSIPVVATVAGGPVAGIVAWAAEKVLSNAVNDVTTVYYKVTGQWDQPKIIKMRPSRV
ncbi:MAG: hypothetical protein KDH94_05010, partial [Coxiellaceae bacterium]|nr:hypothetical protein [Coxiellaceae bacterium]